MPSNVTYGNKSQARKNSKEEWEKKKEVVRAGNSQRITSLHPSTAPSVIYFLANYPRSWIDLSRTWRSPHLSTYFDMLGKQQKKKSSSPPSSNSFNTSDFHFYSCRF
ncbi:hypothetical protein F4774DRAFT_422789 [Daldinia eschscholtzii]|nr:hypothetical protein F4774DRAFT_422789 [Daldinia eschscholtzii]